MKPWQNRITKYSDEAPDQLLANPRNFRMHPDSQAGALRGVLSEVGIVQNVIANERTGFLIDGHLRVMEALKSGQPTIPVTWVDVSEDEEALILATLDPIAALAGTDAIKLEALLHDVSTADAAVQQMLDNLATEAGIVPGLAEGQGGDEFDTTPDDGPTRTAVGDLWLIGGKHRLLVGDCTLAENVARLMDGERADVCFTDTPYNINYQANESIESLKARNRRTDGLIVANDDTADIAIRGVAQMFTTLKPGAAMYICFPAEQPTVLAQMWGEDTHLQSMIVWVKDRIVMGRKDHHYQHEPIWYGWREGAAHAWHGNHKQSTVWEIDRPSDSEDHPTEKPIALLLKALENSSKPNDLLIDFFGGSGVALTAAHRISRRAYLCEIEPRYADVILRRAEAEGLDCVKVE